MTFQTNAPVPTPGSILGGHLTQMKAKWGWFVALGIVLIVAGFIAMGNLVLGTVFSVFYVGFTMAVAGVAQIFHAFQVKGWGAFLFWVLSGLVYMAAGVIAINNPVMAAGVLTLVLGVSLVIAGAFRLIAAIQARPHEGWGWLAFSSVITLVLGIEIMLQWPVNSVWVLGLFLGIDLLFTGMAVLMLGLRLKK